METTMNLIVNQNDIYIDAEDEYLAIIFKLEALEFHYCLPKWAYLTSEWTEFTTKKVWLKNRLRKLKAQL